MPRHADASTCRPGRRDVVLLALLVVAASVKAAIHFTYELGSAALAALLLMAATSWGTRMWTLSRLADAEDRARAEEEAGWWSAPLAAYDGGEEDTVAFGRTVVPIATRRAHPHAGTQRAG